MEDFEGKKENLSKILLDEDVSTLKLVQETKGVEEALRQAKDVIRTHFRFINNEIVPEAQKGNKEAMEELDAWNEKLKELELFHDELEELLKGDE